MEYSFSFVMGRNAGILFFNPCVVLLSNFSSNSGAGSNERLQQEQRGALTAG